jgi:hypothetical protein
MLAMLAGAGYAQPQTPSPPPDVPDTIHNGGGDHVPYIPHVKYFLSPPEVAEGLIVGGHIHFRFRSDGPIMRYNIMWSRPGLRNTDMRWVNSWAGVGWQDYVINEIPVRDADYSFEVQAESWKAETPYDGVVSKHQITPFVSKTFHVPPRRRLDAGSARVVPHAPFSTPARRRTNPFSRSDTRPPQTPVPTPPHNP